VPFKAQFSILTALLVDNLPVAAMSAMGASTIFACDVGSVRKINCPSHLNSIHFFTRSTITRPGTLVTQFRGGGC
jgi:hypothetical protein